MRTVCSLNSKDIIFRFVVLLLSLILLTACGEGQEDEDSYDPGGLEDETTNYTDIYRRALTEEENSGLLEPKIQAKPDGHGNVHFMFYTRGIDLDLDQAGVPADSDLIANTMRFDINHITYDVSEGRVSTEEVITDSAVGDIQTPASPTSEAADGDQGIDNCSVLGMDITPAGQPVVVYQGGLRSEFEGGQNCNPSYQGDLMVSVRAGNTWDEYLGIQGNASLKNGMLPDGLVGKAGDVAVDRDGNIHMIAQHYYENCDQTAINYPDLLYVQQAPTDLGNFDISWEEVVDEGNMYAAGGGVQSAIGYHSRLLLDGSNATIPEQPIAFYSGLGSGDRFSLRAARRIEEDNWEIEVIRTVSSDYIIDFISPAIANDGTIGVAYFLRRVNIEEDEMGDHLCYAQRVVDEEGNVSWENIEVDYQSYCGDYCSLAFDSNNLPAIAYYDRRPYTPYRERHDVKLAYLDGYEWRKEVVAKHGRIGFYNSLWFSGTTPFVASYELDQVEEVIDGNYTVTENHSIVLFRRDRGLERTNPIGEEEELLEE